MYNMNNSTKRRRRMRSFGCLLIFVLHFVLFLRAGAQAPLPDYVCQGETRRYFVEGTPGSFYIWRIDGIIQEGYTTSELLCTWNNIKTYLLEVQEISIEGCTGPSRSGFVFVSASGMVGLVIHEVFSPNGDLINDNWIIGNSEAFPEMDVTVYNRWGQAVWRSARGYPVPWDGKSRGAGLPVDSYHYIIDLHNGSKPLAGIVTIVR
jgi:gliding motility-associated-like protein